jgi:hypothetical protein
MTRAALWHRQFRHLRKVQTPEGQERGRTILSTAYRSDTSKGSLFLSAGDRRCLDLAPATDIVPQKRIFTKRSVNFTGMITLCARELATEIVR